MSSIRGEGSFPVGELARTRRARRTGGSSGNGITVYSTPSSYGATKASVGNCMGFSAERTSPSPGQPDKSPGLVEKGGQCGGHGGRGCSIVHEQICYSKVRIASWRRREYSFDKVRRRERRRKPIHFSEPKAREHVKYLWVKSNGAWSLALCDTSTTRPFRVNGDR